MRTPEPRYFGPCDYGYGYPFFFNPQDVQKNTPSTQYWLHKLTEAGQRKIRELKSSAAQVHDADVEAFLEEHELNEEVQQYIDDLKTYAILARRIRNTLLPLQRKLKEVISRIDLPGNAVPGVPEYDDDALSKDRIYNTIKNYLLANNLVEPCAEREEEIKRIEDTLVGLEDQLNMPRSEDAQRQFIESVAKIVGYEIKSI